MVVNRRVLFVDDEPRVLEAFEHNLAFDFEVETAISGAKALQAIDRARAEGRDFAVIVSDMRMPQMNGAEFLAHARARAPETVRVLLTGQSDLEAAADAVNRGGLFRFLFKPCPIPELSRVLEDAIEQHRVIGAERELLEQTLRGAVGALVELLGLACPIALGRAQMVEAYVMHMATKLGFGASWELRLAGQLCLIGCIAVPPEALARHFAGERPRPEVRRMLASIPEVGANLIAPIPRLERVAAIVRNQDQPAGDEFVARGARLLKVARAADALTSRGGSVAAAVKALRRAEEYDAALLDALADFHGTAEEGFEIRMLGIGDLIDGMVLDQDVLSNGGQLLVARGREITLAMLERLNNFSRTAGIVQPLRVLVPCSKPIVRVA